MPQFWLPSLRDASQGRRRSNRIAQDNLRIENIMIFKHIGSSLSSGLLRAYSAHQICIQVGQGSEAVVSLVARGVAERNLERGGAK